MIVIVTETVKREVTLDVPDDADDVTITKLAKSSDDWVELYPEYSIDNKTLS